MRLLNHFHLKQSMSKNFKMFFETAACPHNSVRGLAIDRFSVTSEKPTVDQQKRKMPSSIAINRHLGSQLSLSLSFNPRLQLSLFNAQNHTRRLVPQNFLVVSCIKGPHNIISERKCRNIDFFIRV